MSPRTLRFATLALATVALVAGTACSPGRADAAEPAASPGTSVAADAASTNAAAAPAHEHPAALAAESVLDGASLFHLRDAWTDQRGRTLHLADLEGHPTVVVMFYGSCMTACPVLLRDAELIEAALPEADRARARFLMVTFDPVNDTPERMADYAAEKGLDRERWFFLTADGSAVRRLAGVLGVRYRPDGRGGFAHTNLVTLLDPGGVVTLRREGLGLDPGPVAAAIAAM